MLRDILCQHQQAAKKDGQPLIWSSPIEEIDFTRPRYDQSSYFGRFWHFVDVTDPRTLLASSKDAEEAKNLVEMVVKKQPGWEKVDPEEVWAKKKIVGAVYGANGQIALPLRFSAFVPLNLITLFFMLHPSQQTPGRAMFWQWWNQTYNSGLNFANRGDAGEVDVKTLAVSYGLAVTVSCGMSKLGGQFVSRFGDRLPSVFKILVPYIAVASAGLANVAMVRSSDFINGVEVFDEETGESLGRSKKAGQVAVGQVAASRVLLPLPLMTIPPIAMQFLFGNVGFLKARKAALDVPVNLAVIAAVLMVALPACIALFPQELVLPVSKLEPEFQGRTIKDNEVKAVKFDKGL